MIKGGLLALLPRFSIGVFNEGGGLLFRFHFYEQPGNHRIKDISFISLNNFNLITEFLCNHRIKHVARSGSPSGDEVPAPGDYRTGCPEGWDHVGGVVDIRHTCGLAIRGS